ncbi:hypothetical protein Pla110_36930 [Polystyrenella longa]|uniref:Large cysteine-rich periplasmic protein OmcB n=1 Tax=Polystyrenella longa TaxID=2528007 RepID=A0A518CRT5_9PLAN|nr:hypothetical protein [Polystyrenella longa]QDU81941.1 hypothetical protein Pla110_36930 [Polystyrenella longa]
MTFLRNNLTLHNSKGRACIPWLALGIVVSLSGCVSMFSRPAAVQNQAYPNGGVPNSQFYSAPQSVAPAPQQIPRQSFYPPAPGRSTPYRPGGGFFRGAPQQSIPQRQYSPPVNPRNQVPRVGAPAPGSPAAPLLRPQPLSPTQPAVVPPLTPGIQERPRTYKEPTENPANIDSLPPAPQSNGQEQTYKKTAPPAPIDPVLGAPSEDILFGDEEPSPANDDLEFLLRKQPVDEALQPFGELIESEKFEPDEDETFEAPPVDNAGEDNIEDPFARSTPFELPPIKAPAPVDKLFEETSVPPLNDVELLTSPAIKPSSGQDSQPLESDVETFKMDPGSANSGSDAGPLLEFNSSSLRDELEIKVVNQGKMQVGGGTLFEVFIENQSTEVFRDVTLKAAFPKTLFVPSREDAEMTRFIPRIDPGEELKVPLTLFSEETGYHCVRFSLVNATRNELSWKSACVTYIPETIRTELLGPEKISIDSNAVFTLLVQNLSDQQLEDVSVNLRYDPVLKYLDSTNAVQQQDQELNLALSRVKPGETIPVRFSFRGVQESENTSLTVRTTSANFPSADTGLYLSVQHPKGALDLDLAQPLDALQVGEETELTIVCRNHGLETLRNSQLELQLPSHVRLIRSGWGAQSSTTAADSLKEGTGKLELPVPDIPPGISVGYTIRLHVEKRGNDPLEVRYLNGTTTPSELSRNLPLVVTE